MGAKTVEKFKNEIIKLHNKYSHAISLKGVRYNRLCQAVMSYPCQSIEIMFDCFLAGLMSKNVIYFKEQKEAEEEVNNETNK